MRILGEPITILEDTSCTCDFIGTRTFQGCIGMLAVDVFQAFGHEMKHAPVFLHLTQIFDVVGEVALG